MSEDVTIPTSGYTGVRGRGAALGIDIEVTDNTEKREMDGNSMMRVGLRVRANGQEGELQLTSRASEKQTTWNGFVFEYRGGWRDKVNLRVTRLPSAR